MNWVLLDLTILTCYPANTRPLYLKLINAILFIPFSFQEYLARLKVSSKFRFLKLEQLEQCLLGANLSNSNWSNLFILIT